MRYLILSLMLMVLGCDGPQETTRSNRRGNPPPQGITLSAHHFMRRYAPDDAFDVTCNSVFNIEPGLGVYPCTVTLTDRREHRILGLICRESNYASTTDNCYVSGSF